MSISAARAVTAAISAKLPRLDDKLTREPQVAALAVGAPVGIHNPLHIDVVR